MSAPIPKAWTALYVRELFKLQGELVKLQGWVVNQGLKVVVIFEGRDAAGKSGVIKRITQRLNPRGCRVAALPAPNERERTQWYFQRGALYRWTTQLAPVARPQWLIELRASRATPSGQALQAGSRHRRRSRAATHTAKPPSRLRWPFSR